MKQVREIIDAANDKVGLDQFLIWINKWPKTIQCLGLNYVMAK